MKLMNEDIDRMMNVRLQERYVWEAEKTDGTIITVGEFLDDCVRFSLVPVKCFEGVLPKHDIIGVPMIRRFMRMFMHSVGSGKQWSEHVHCIVCKGFRVYVKSNDGTVLLTPEDFELYL